MPSGSYETGLTRPDALLRGAAEQDDLTAGRAGALSAGNSDHVPVGTHGEHPGAAAALHLPQLVMQRGDLILQLLDLILQSDDPPDALQGDALLGELLDLPQLIDIVRRVPTMPAALPLGGDQAHPVILAQGLGVHISQLGSD